MWRYLSRFVVGGLSLGGASTAAAQCVSIPDGSGGAAVHCSDGTMGHLSTATNGAVTGMVGGQPVVGAADQLLGPGLSAGVIPGIVNPDVSAVTAPVPPPPLVAPSAQVGVSEERPFSAYPDPEGAGLRRQPGEE